MNPVEKLEAAIAKLEGLKTESTSGTWFWEAPSAESWPQGDEGLSATSGEWKTCQYYCQFAPTSSTSRGVSGSPGHEHLQSETVLYGWGYDASGISGEPADRELIVTLHRTIDFQLDYLRIARGVAGAQLKGEQAELIRDFGLQLADAILGDLA